MVQLQYKIGHHYIPALFKKYQISFLSLFILIISYFSWEELTDIFDYILIFILFFSLDILMLQTRVKSPWKIRLIGAIFAESWAIVSLSSLLKVSYIIEYLLLLIIIILFFLFLIESWRMMENKIDWYGNSKIARNYKSQVIKDLKKDPTLSEKYYTFFWGRKILSYSQSIQLGLITSISLFALILYMLAGFFLGDSTAMSTYYIPRFFDEKLSRFIILLIIVLIEFWNKTKEKQYKTLEEHKPLESEPQLSFIHSVFKSKISYIYLFLTYLNLTFIFFGISIIVWYIIYLLRYIKSPRGAFTESDFIPLLGDIYYNYIFAIIISFSFLIILLAFLHAHKVIFKNFANRYNSLKLLEYQKYQEIFIFIPLIYFFSFSLLKFDMSNISRTKYLFMLFPIILFSILLLLNYKFGRRTPLTKFREHIIWLTGLSFIIGLLINNYKLIIILYGFFVISVIVHFIQNLNDNKFDSQIKQIVVLLVPSPFLLHFMGVPTGNILILSFLLILLLITLREKSRMKALPPKKQKFPKWVNILFGLGGPYSIADLNELKK